MANTNPECFSLLIKTTTRKEIQRQVHVTTAIRSPRLLPAHARRRRGDLFGNHRRHDSGKTYGLPRLIYITFGNLQRCTKCIFWSNRTGES